jgi:integrase
MSRPRTGQVTEWRWEDGRTITYGARLRAYGRRHRLVFGTNHQGWNRIRAEIEVEQILHQVQRGTPGRRRREGHQSSACAARALTATSRSVPSLAGSSQ